MQAVAVSAVPTNWPMQMECATTVPSMRKSRVQSVPAEVDSPETQFRASV